MKNLLDKLSSYNLFNYLLPGVIFSFVGSEITSYSLLQKDLFTAFFFYYFIGLVISRVGSLFVEPTLQYLKLIQYSEYKNFVKANSKDPKIDVLLEVSNMYRTIIALFIALPILVLYEKISFIWPWFSKSEPYLILTTLLALFIFSYKKQVAYIRKRVEANVNESN